MMYRLLFLLTFSGSLFAQTLLVEKQQFSIDNFKTFNGSTIKQVKVGWESYGTLNEEKDNVVLITHFFSGNSHAAGKYTENDPQPGYWDSIIGPDKAIDTNRFFVISVDSLVNLGVHNPNVITTGPASIDPETGKRYGLTFPVVTIRDFVNVQKAVLESLGINKLYAVAGPSMGSLQAIDWAATYPVMVPRLISVIGGAAVDAWTVTKLESWAMPIRLDPNWNEGSYYGQAAPIEGLTQSLMTITQDALHPLFFNAVGQSDGVNFEPLEQAPLNDINQHHSIVNWLRNRAASRASMVDANHLIYLVRANQLFLAGHGGSLTEGLKKVKAKTLFIPAKDDLILMPYLAETAHQEMSALKKDSTLIYLQGSAGHLDGVSGIAQHSESIRSFLSE